ncbi:AAA family ATPase [Flavobacterium psychrophilum]|uniref:AAA family ATPase n=1 Tax=Flavobacterium psychrophilum TaxID=96345 RepID=UPI001C8F57E6|nr:AAA family ATPase [Flavobacterium psychrophilum]ELI6455964.1 AAA family ATPase [Flavobacterium psychrophilum]QZK99531.1 AAA family ATPase [Flavobacterium psychrophilum]
MEFKNVEDLIKIVNNSLGSFCNAFGDKRKVLANMGKRPKRGVLFAYDPSKNRDWAINEGGGTEIQYHIAFDVSSLVLRYGLGFNTQYVQFANEMSMVDYMKPFMNAFLKLEDNIHSLLPKYDFVIGDIGMLKKPVANEYVLFGRNIKAQKEGQNFSIDDIVFNEILDDLKSQLTAYELVFKEKNNSKIVEMNNQNIDKVLLQKGQIILQGPPGTGKTYTAKEVANRLIKSNKINFDNNLVKNSLKVGLKIQSASNKTEYEIVSIENTKCSIKGIESKEYIITFQSIIEAINLKIWESGNQKNGLDPYKAAIGKYLYENINNLEYSINEHIELIQFHPAYTYEDFVRGITAKSNGNNIEYKTENKLLASFAEKALKNYQDSRKDAKSISEEQNIEATFEDFIDNIQDEIDKKGKYSISNLAYINQIDEDAFRYTGDNWSTTFRIPFSEILKLHKLNITERKDIKKQSSVIGRAKQHATYYFNLLEKFRAFMPTVLLIDDQLTVNENNYVLIIDEINRANLPAVLGELIYALEYRGETVKSMYDIDGDNSLIIPPNLYVIGTMNTSDRSVGHIDYAIRRRFAFVDVLPEVLKIDNFQEEKFKEISKLFISNIEEYSNDSKIPLKKSDFLSEEFSPEDVWLGHSYFISDDDSFDVRLEYEIKPILKEYIKDGILKQSAEEIINNL